MTLRSPLVKASAALLLLTIGLTGCAYQDETPGVPPGVMFSVQPVFPRSYDLTAIGPRELTGEALTAAWHLKARHLAAGRKFKTTGVTVHDKESIQQVYTGYGSVPVRTKNRTVSGTVEILQ
ncbi:MAG TPA: hypothetical protein VF614_11760 [Chthoniobacteraceae bacterium]|jgi:hypothetical protein